MKVLTIGSFDLLHYGHIYLFQRAALFGELTVGVNSDAFITKYKGKPPVLTQEERMENIRSLGLPVVLNETEGRELIQEFAPNVIAIGSDWARKDYLKQINVTQDELDEAGIMVLYIPYTNTISSTAIKERLNES